MKLYRSPAICTLTLAVAALFAFTSTNLFAQASSPYVPVGPPFSVGNQSFSVPQGSVPLVPPPDPRNGGVQLRQSLDGIDFLDSHCGCLPPDTNAAVGNDYVVETVNLQIRIWDKNTGLVQLDQNLATFFGAFSGGDPYVVYDDHERRWYVSAFNSTDSGLLLAVSNDANPLDGFQVHQLANLGVPDYQKLGYNRDAIFISFNNFGPGGGAAATIISIDKAAIYSGTLIFYVSVPKFQFRAMPPAQMHGDDQGGVEWFVSTDGTDAGGNTIRVTKMTHYLSNTPEFTYTSLPVTEYRSATKADQPGGTITTFPNTTTTQVHYRNGYLVSAMSSATAADGFVYPKGLFFRINVRRDPPRLVRQGVIDPGQGVAVQMLSADEDKEGRLGFTWMESSTNEYLSMWVGTRRAALPSAPGFGFFYLNFRIGDYSTIVLDPSDQVTFWSANEYIGSDGQTDIWRTHITSFTAH